MREKLITDNSSERIYVRFDGDRVGLVSQSKHNIRDIKTTILSTLEAPELAEFIRSCNHENRRN